MIDMEKLGEVIVGMESLMEGYNNLEKDLILREIRGRFDARIRQTRANEISGNAINQMLPKSFRNMLKKDKEDE